MSSTISRNLLKFMSIESVMLSNHLIFCHFSFCLQSFPASGSFPTNRLFNIRYPKNIGASALASVPPMNIQGWFPLGLTGLISLLSKETWRVFSTSAIWKHQFFGSQISLWPTVTSVHDYWKNHCFNCKDLGWQSDVSFLICCLGLS